MILPRKHDKAGGLTPKPEAQERVKVPECPGKKALRLAPRNPAPRAETPGKNPPNSAPSGGRLNQPMTAPRITTPAQPAPRLPGNPYCRLEEWIIEGLDFLGESPPNVPAAAKCLAAVEKEFAGRQLPGKLGCRLHFFKESLERIRKDLLRDRIDRELKQVKPLLEQQPPRVDRAAEELQAAAALLKEAPDPALQAELEILRRKIGILEKQLQQRRATRSWSMPAIPLRLPRVSLRVMALVMAGGGMLIAGIKWLNPPPSGEISEVNVQVVPAGAELFTNGVAVGDTNYPVRLKGVAGTKLNLEARLAGYANLKRKLSLPTSGKVASETLELQPLPATLVVQSEPVAHDVWVHVDGQPAVIASNAVRGIELNPGSPLEVSLAVAEYAPVSRTLPALRPGERRVVDFGELAMLPGSLRPKIEPQDASFWVVYPGHDPVPFGASSNLQGITPKVPFQLIAQRSGYLPLTNSFTLKPGQVCECDLGRLQPMPAALRVLALPRPFELQVEWDDKPHNFGAAGEASGLPPGKPLIVTVAAEGCEAWSTNLVLEPAETRTLSLGKLSIAEGYMLVKAEPVGGTVSYRVDGGMETVIGVTDTIPSLPLGHQVLVTLNKQGYLPVTKNCLFQHSGEMIDFGALKPSLTFLAEQMHKAVQSGDVATIEKILTQYSSDYPLLVDQPSPSEGDAPTPLLTAVRRGQDKVVDYLVKCGADVNRANRYRVTPLFEAARKGNVAIVKKLLAAHADVRSKNLSGQTPIFAVVLSSHNVEIANLLLASGADPNVRDLSGETPVYLAEENHTDDILQALEHPPQRVAGQ